MLIVTDTTAPTGRSADGRAFVAFDRIQKNCDGQMLVVKDLNLSISKGEFLMMLAGFETATHGEILLDGCPINQVPPHKPDRVAVFNDGRTQQLAPPADLYEQPEKQLRGVRWSRSRSEYNNNEKSNRETWNETSLDLVNGILCPDLAGIC